MNLPISIHDTKANPIVQTFQESTVEHPIDINIELYSAGFFDGLTGLNAELPHLRDYWDGYALGYREYWCGLLGLEIPPGEIPNQKLRALLAA